MNLTVRNNNGSVRHKLTRSFCFLALILCVTAADFDENTQANAGISNKDALRLGEKIYRDGILPSGKPVSALVKGDVSVEGTMFSCQNCHMRGGLGSFEGGIFTPPTNGANLYRPLKKVYKGFVIEGAPPVRPAYTDEMLSALLMYGVDPNGRIINEVMPRYQLDDGDMKILISYLKSLSSRFSPGITDTEIRFATVVTEDVDPKDRERMLAPLEYYFKSKNSQAGYFQTPAGFRSRRMAETMFPSREFILRRLLLSRWVLKGRPETWRGQLEDYYRKEPVFALIGGITAGEWKPVHQFSEQHRIPCLFPLTDFPVISETDWYTLYLSKGLYQEGVGAARYLNGVDRAIAERPIVQFVRDTRQGQALSTGFLQTWHDYERKAPITVTLKKKEKLTGKRLQKILEREKPGVVIIWDGPDALPGLEVLSTAKNRPGLVFMSSGYLGRSVSTINEQVRDFTYITYPYRLPKEKNSISSGSPSMGTKNSFSPNATKFENQAYSIIEVLNMAFMKMSGNYYRDNFLDVIDCIMDQEVPLYERLSFGPGQRYASKGCYIVQLSKGPKPAFIRKSEWVIH